MKERVLEAVSQPESDEPDDHKKHIASLTHVFEKVAPVFNAVVQVSNKAELKVWHWIKTVQARPHH